MDELGVVLGNAILLARSGAAFYNTMTEKMVWITDFMDDVLYGDRHENSLWDLWGGDLKEVFPNFSVAITEFCIGNIGAELFRFWSSAETDYISIEQAKNAMDSIGGNNDVGYDDGTPARGPIRIKEGLDVDERIINAWSQALDHVVAVAGRDDDIKIEFERVYETDTAAGGGLFNASFSNDAVTRAESVKMISPFGFLNKAAVFGGARGSSVHYKSYMFGSNVLLFDNNLTSYASLDSAPPPDTDRRHLQRAFDMNDAELDTFISEIVTKSGGTVTDCPRYGGCVRPGKRSAAGSSGAGNAKRARKSDGRPNVGRAGGEGDSVPSSGLRFASFNKLNNSVQFTFSTHNGRYYYTANLFWLRADDFCTTDLVYRRAAVSSLCQCQRPTLAWRACLLVTPINAATVRSGDGMRTELEKVVLASFAAVWSTYVKKRRTPHSSLVVLSGFVGMPIVPTDPHSFLRTRPVRNAPRGDNAMFPMCAFHRWLRAHLYSTWVARAGENVLLSMLDSKGGRGVIINRPVFMTNGAGGGVGMGQKVFARYMTFEDVAQKVLLLTKHYLVNGYTDPAREQHECAVAYARGGSFVDFDTADMMDAADMEHHHLEGERNVVGGPGKLWCDLFEAPSYLYADVDVLATLGFNPVSFATAHDGAGRTFEHADPVSGEMCTVYCSVLLRAVDPRNNNSLNGAGEELADINRVGAGGADPCGGAIRVLRTRTDQWQTSPLDAHRTLEIARLQNGQHVALYERYRETVHDLNVVWPGVRLINITFVDPQLKHVAFAFFAGGDDVAEMTLERLHAFSDHCVREKLLPPPILYTVQNHVLTALYGRG